MMNTNKKNFCRIYPLDKDIKRTWYVEYIRDGKRLKKYGQLKHCRTLEEKMAEARRLQNEILHELQHPGPDYISCREKSTIIEALQQVLNYRCTFVNKKTVITYEGKLTHFAKWFRTNNQDAINKMLAIQYINALQSQGLGNTTINHYKATLKSLFGELVKNKIVAENPFEGIKKLKERRESYKYFDKAQQAILARGIAARDVELWLACQFQYYLLLRPDELRTIKCGDFNLKNASICVRGDISKNDYTQYIRIPDQFLSAIAFIKNYPAHYYVFSAHGQPGAIAHNKKYFPDRHQAILKELGVDTRKHKFYSWKHTGAAMYYLATHDLKGLKEQGRWHSLDMVNEYLKNVGVLDMESVKRNFPAIAG